MPNILSMNNMIILCGVDGDIATSADAGNLKKAMDGFVPIPLAVTVMMITHYSDKSGAWGHPLEGYCHANGK